MRPLLDRAQAVLLLLADLLRVVRLPGAQLLPLLRACMVSLTVEGQKLLQEKATRLLVAAFQGYPAQVRCCAARLFCSVRWLSCCARSKSARWAAAAHLAASPVPPSFSLPPTLSHHPPIPPHPSFPPSPCCHLQWGTVLDELFAQVVPYLPGGPRPARDFPASEDARTCIQMLTAAVLQMIQVGGCWWVGAGGWVLVGAGGCWRVGAGG
jgi:hypothetical protein